MNSPTVHINHYCPKERHPNNNPMLRRWTNFWMRFAGMSPGGRLATWLATWFALPHKDRVYLAHVNPRGYIALSATIHHADLHLGANVFIDDRVVIFQRETGGSIELGDRVYIYRDTIMETGHGGSLHIGAHSSIHPRCQLNAYVAPIRIGSGVMIAPNCAFYSYDHGIVPGRSIREQPLQSRGPIVIGDECWFGVGSIVLSGVCIGHGAVIGAGSVVTQDVPAGAIAVGVPAQVVKMRSDLLIT
jgi:acetyltransferase-like isoleucine patch superfamily enzyme